MDEDALKKGAVDFADWLWKNVSENEMSRHSFDYFYELFLCQVKERQTNEN